MKNRFKFRAALQTLTQVCPPPGCKPYDAHSIIVTPFEIKENGYYIDLDVAQKTFENKYPNASFDDFIEKIIKQDYIKDIDCHLIMTKDFTNLMQTTTIFDATKFKNLSPEQQNEWLLNHTKEEWPGFEIFEGDVVELKYAKDIMDYGVVSFSRGGYTKGATHISSYQKNTTIVGNIYEGYPDKARHDVEYYFKYIAPKNPLMSR